MEQQVGYNLVDLSNDTIVQKWGGVWGQFPSPPGTITLPSGDQVCGMQQGDVVQHYRLDPWMMAPPAPTIDDVITERSRRLAVGFNYDFGTPEAPNVQHIGTTTNDMRGWDEVTAWANAQVALNDTTSTIEILTDSGTATVTAVEWMKIVNASTAFRQPIWAASFVLQSMNPIPADYTNDKYWP